MYTKEEAREKVSQLVERFSEQIASYKKSEYNETLTRKDFIDPFFEALGWDMNNRQGAWEAYREVIHEDKLKVGGVITAPDYSFRLVGGQRLFFVEAKKPSIYIKDDLSPAYQVRLYGWNAKLAISVVTDFEEFAIYDCSKKPLRTDKTSKARVNYFTYKDYLKEFDFFWNTFSKEQVIKGGLIKFQQSDKKGTATVDKDFLENLDKWRKELAANIFKNNPDISEDELNYAVQQTIDRIIFLRIAEDRGLEPYGQLKSSLQNEEQYKELYRQFRVADDKYNSGLFYFKKEKANNKEPDTISGKLVIENKVIKSIISSLYPPQSEFLFNVLPVEILGSAYEQFLGKQIIVKSSKAIIEDKPEVRKAGGVYYTPQYIVEYIVENTIGKLAPLNPPNGGIWKTPAEVAKLKIVDPACGSGSFLLGAYQYLLKWHMLYYANNVQTGKHKEAVLTPDGSLTTAEKKRILLNNIYGVDIDRNAVEVTKLSLLLKCMEGETTASINTQMTFFNERVLPSLENNIKSGNSLIDIDFYDGQFDFDPSMEKKIKPFNWQQAFPDVFKQGGFDVVIGNPPYVRVDTLEMYSKDYILKTFTSAKGKYDLYYLFVERATSLLKQAGLLGFIIPNRFTTNDSGHNLRKHLTENCKVITINSVSKIKVFKEASVYPCILIIEAGKHIQEIKISETYKIENLKHPENSYAFKDKQIKELPNFIFPLNSNIETLNLYFRIFKKSIPIEKIFIIQEGLRIPKEIEEKIGKYHILKQYQFNRYSSIKEGTYLSEENLRKNISLTTERFKNCLKEKLVIAEDALRIEAIYDNSRSICQGGVYFATLKEQYEKLNLKFLLAMINSNLINAFYNSLYSGMHMGGGYMRYRTSFLNNLPIKIPENSSEKSSHNEIVKLVETMLQLNKEKQQTTIPDQIDHLKARIQYTDDKINNLVYQLYGLSEEEIEIVEER